MPDKFTEGSFGQAHFTVTKKGLKTDYEMHGTIIKVESKYLLFRDNDEYLYLVDRKDFEFESKEFKTK